MSSRVLRRFQGKDTFIENPPEDDSSDTVINSAGCGGARHKNPDVNPYDLLNLESHSESDEGQEDDNDEIESRESTTHDDSQQKKKKKKKKKKKHPKTAGAVRKNSEEVDEFELDFDVDVPETKETDQDGNQSTSIVKEDNKNSGSSLVFSIKLKNLNPTNELKRIFGSSIVETDLSRRRRRRPLPKNLWLVCAKKTWPPLGKTGISMKIDRNPNGCSFCYEHNSEYQQVQKKFLAAVDSLNPENIVSIITSHPYHVDGLIQLSDLCKMNDDLQMAADVIERALYCLESAFHPLFNMGRGFCRMDFRRQENRALFICLFKHLTFVGQRACYQTALELCKLLLALDFDSDPLAVILCFDFYALRSRNYAWLIAAAEELEPTRNVSQLPNFAFSTALAHFFLTRSEKSGDFSKADDLLQKALILFPSTLLILLEKCCVQIDARVSAHPFFTTEGEWGQSQALKRMVALYVHRTYHEWKNRRVLPWLEKNVHLVLDRVDAGDPYVEECRKRRETRYPVTPRNVARHIILSDIKEVTATLSGDITSPIYSFDPMPPLDSIDLYLPPERRRLQNNSSAFSVFFRSLLPNFRMDEQLAPNAQIAEDFEERAAGLAAQGPMIGETLRDSVTILMDAIGAVLANMPMRDDDDDDDEDFESDSEDEEG